MTPARSVIGHNYLWFGCCSGSFESSKNLFRAILTEAGKIKERGMQEFGGTIMIADRVEIIHQGDLNGNQWIIRVELPSDFWRLEKETEPLKGLAQ
jgi:hypothetical protein